MTVGQKTLPATVEGATWNSNGTQVLAHDIDAARRVHHALVAKGYRPDVGENFSLAETDCYGFTYQIPGESGLPITLVYVPLDGSRLNYEVVYCHEQGAWERYTIGSEELFVHSFDAERAADICGSQFPSAAVMVRPALLD